jgi:hypothetical protein
MIIPDDHHPGWIKAISGQKTPNYELLATKILIGRLTLTYEIDPSPETTRKSVSELRTFFERNIDLPKAQADLKRIFDEAVTK